MSILGNLLCALGLHAWFPEIELDKNSAWRRFSGHREVRDVCGREHCGRTRTFQFVERIHKRAPPQ